MQIQSICAGNRPANSERDPWRLAGDPADRQIVARSRHGLTIALLAVHDAGKMVPRAGSPVLNKINHVEDSGTGQTLREFLTFFRILSHRFLHMQANGWNLLRDPKTRTPPLLQTRTARMRIRSVALPQKITLRHAPMARRPSAAERAMSHWQSFRESLRESPGGSRSISADASGRLPLEEL